MTFPLPAGARLSVDLAALIANWRELDARARPGRAAAVVKADAYGLGADFVGPALTQAGCRTFFVAFPAEAVALWRFVTDPEIIVLNALDASGLAQCRDRGFTPTLNSPAEAAWWLENGRGQPAGLMVDTGMNRLGLTETEALAFAGAMRPRLLLSHFVAADEPERLLNRRQHESFQRVARAFAGVESSLPNSAGLFLGAEFASDLARPGIALFGGAPVAGQPNPMRTVATLEARVTQVRAAKAGETVSYGATQTLTHDTTIAVAAIGYADGWPRAASATGVALRAGGSPGGRGFVAGGLAPILGRVTMDATLFDVTDCGEVKPGDWIELFGPHIALDDAAASAGTISYELLTAIGKRVERRYAVA